MSSSHQVRGWHNGSPRSSGAGYGVVMSEGVRDQLFDPGWRSVRVSLGGDETVEISLSPSFWGSCRELRGVPIGRWLLRNQLAPWPKGRPPHLVIEEVDLKQFRLLAG